jgi:hypothetical protein
MCSSKQLHDQQTPPNLGDAGATIVPTAGHPIFGISSGYCEYGDAFPQIT